MSKGPESFGKMRPEYARGMTIAFEFAGSVLIFWLAGRWVDGWLGTEPWFQVVGSLIGWGGGFAQVFYKAKRMEEAERASKERAQQK